MLSQSSLSPTSGAYYLVAEERVELPCPRALVSKTSVSPNSTTRPNFVGLRLLPMFSANALPIDLG